MSGPRQTRDTWRGLGDAWTAVSYILSGIAVWGGAGWLLDRWLSTGPVLLVIGILVGNFAGVYLVYIRTFPKEASRAS
ncbi:MAG TPA: AtpZ/AtpI family protein [Actinomycetota bacterium]|nr:AtpZ/AtpI family protein [Actinomycetota bacterium]